MTAFVDMDALRTLAQSLAGPRVTVIWNDDENANGEFFGFSGLAFDGQVLPAALNGNDPATYGNGAVVKLSVTASVGVGRVDDFRETFDPTPTVDAPAGQRIVTQVGSRHFTWSILCMADTYPAALTIAERVRTLMQRRSTLDALKAAGCALRAVTLTRGLPKAEWHHRTMSSCVVEVFLTHGLPDGGLQDTTVDPNGWIETVSPLTGEYDG